MKKVFAIISMLAIIAAVGAVSCKKEAKDSIKLDKNSVNVSYKGEVVTMKVTASGEFSSQPSAEWLSASGADITVKPNYYEANRSADVVFHCGAESATVTVNQEGSGPKEVTSLAIDAMAAADWATFWELVDMPDAQKDQVMSAYNEKTSEGGEGSDFKGYEILSETIDNTKGEAVVKVKYLYEEHDPSEYDWSLLKKDGRWRIPASALGK